MGNYDMSEEDTERMVAAVDLVRRSGGTAFDFGYLHEDVPVNQADWHASAYYRGARVSVEHHESPLGAIEALAKRILRGAKCKCGKLVALSNQGAHWNPGTLADGTKLTRQQAKRQCLWTRQGKRWESTCKAPPIRKTW